MAKIPCRDALVRGDFVQCALAKYAIPLTKFRVWDAVATKLTGTAASDDLALVTGAFATAAPTIETSDGKNTTVAQYARVQFPLGPEYDPGASVKIRINAGMKTTVSGTTGAVDVECYRNGLTPDLCATAQTSVNSLVAADVDFDITSTALVPGDVLDIRIKGNIVDSGTVTVVIVQINSVSVLMDIRC